MNNTPNDANNANITRRQFVGRGVAGLFGAGCAGAASGAGPAKGVYPEPAREMPLREETDVIVAGGGPAGVAAALAAARSGARVRLFECAGCLGGVWTAGLLTWIFDFNKPGLTRELSRKLEERGARTGTSQTNFAYVPEDMKLLLEELCMEAGVKLSLHTRVAAAGREGGRLDAVITESKSGREAWRAKVFIDATGDGDLGALAGCGWDIGNGPERTTQPLTLNALVAVRDAEAVKHCISFYQGNNIHQQAWQNFKKEIERAGEEPSYGHPTLFQVRDELLTFMINHEYGVLPYDAEQVTAATVRARAEVHRIARALRKLGGPWEGFQVVATAEQIGVRDGRRIHGRHTVTREDLLKGARYEDAVTRATFNVDIHAASREKNRAETISHGNMKTLPYDIPLRALIARDVEGLMMAGRCMSGDFIAHASYRVTGNSVATGEAAGAVAALAARRGCAPHQVAWADAKAAIEKVRGA